MRLPALMTTMGNNQEDKATRRFTFGWRCLAIVLLVLLTAGSAIAQLAGKGSITGTVKDKTGAVITGAQIVATNTATGVSYKVESGNSGLYTFLSLDPGIYTVRTTAKGFEEQRQENIHVNALETVTYVPELTIGSVEQVVTVTDEPPMIETSNATLGSTMEQESYAELPVEMGAYGSPDQRRATDFAYLMPGVQGNGSTTNATTSAGIVNGSGNKGTVAAVYIDGIPFIRAGGAGDPRFVWSAISVDAVDQFQVQTVGYSAIYEGQGVMNYTIKQGALKPHVSMYEFFRNTALNTWGFWKATDPITGALKKPVQHMNEYGIDISGPLVPYGRLKNKIFLFANYNGYRYSATNPTAMSFPTLAEQQGDFSALLSLGTPYKIYDPFTQTACTAKSTNGPCRYQYGYTGGSGTGAAGNPVLSGSSVNVIPSTEFSTIAKAMQSYVPTLTNQNLTNNYVGQNATSLSNWSTTERIDYNISASDTFSVFAAFGRQASSWPVGQSTSGRNVGPIPYNYGQAYAPKTAVGAIEEVHVFSPALVNQFKYGYARYYGPTFDTNQNSAYSASTIGLTGLPAGQAQNSFPIVSFNSTANAPTNWGGTSAYVATAGNYTLLDNLVWNKGKHSITVGGQVEFLQYNYVYATGGTTPLTMTLALTETAGLKASSNSAPTYTATSATGNAYASFLIGEVDKASYTEYLQTETGSRWRAYAGYVQDNWKLTPRLTLDAGVRYDFYPPLREVHDAQSFFNPNLANPVTGINGAVQYAGTGTNTCNCDTPIKNYHKNIAPRFGFAYQIDSKTVLRGSYGIMFTHGNYIGGLAYTMGSLGFSNSLSLSATSTLLAGLDLTGSKNAVSSISAPAGSASGPAFGTGYLNSTQYAATSGSYSGLSTAAGPTTYYVDPSLYSRSPEFENWSLGIQRQLTNNLALNVTYVGSEGHFVTTDGSNGRGYWANQINPQYLTTLGSNLALAATSANCTTYSLSCPTYFNTSYTLATALKPFPYHSVSEQYSMIGNTFYNSIQATVTLRNWHGLTLNSNYSFSRSIDDAGTFRTGWFVPAGTVDLQSSKHFSADRIERSESTTGQPHHAVVTAVYELPFGKTILNQNRLVKAFVGGFKYSTVYQTYSGSPLAVTASTTNTNPATSTAMPTLNPNYYGNPRINGKWGKGITYDNSSKSYIDSNAFQTNTAYQFGNAPRTGAYNLRGPSFSQWDNALVRSFPMHFISNAAKLNFRAEVYNTTNRSYFAINSSAWGASAFGQVTTNGSAPTNRSFQFSGRLDF